MQREWLVLWSHIFEVSVSNRGSCNHLFLLRVLGKIRRNRAKGLMQNSPKSGNTFICTRMCMLNASVCVRVSYNEKVRKWYCEVTLAS